jgi:hypothetical protein
MSELVVDGDGHVCEPADLWSTRLPPHLRERGIRLRWNAESGFDEAYVENRLLTDRGLVGLGNAGESFADLGQGRHYEEINPAGFDPRRRLQVLDAEGIDAAVMYPGLGLSLPAIQDRELAVASCRVYNDWIAEFCAADPDMDAAARAKLFGLNAQRLYGPSRQTSSPRRRSDAACAVFASPR